MLELVSCCEWRWNLAQFKTNFKELFYTNKKFQQFKVYNYSSFREHTSHPYKVKDLVALLFFRLIKEYCY